MTCETCGKAMSEAEVAAYRNRCEDCWAIDSQYESKNFRTVVNDVAEITNQVSPMNKASFWWIIHGRVMRK